MADLPLGNVPTSIINDVDNIIITEGELAKKVPYLDIKNDLLGTETLATGLTIKGSINKHNTEIGDLTQLTTIDKTSLVKAIIENTASLSENTQNIATNTTDITSLKTGLKSADIIPITFNSGLTGDSASLNVYYKYGNRVGIHLYVSGTFTGNSASILFTLPVGYRPTKEVYGTLTMQNVSGVLADCGRIKITPAGTVQFLSLNSCININGSISFPIV